MSTSGWVRGAHLALVGALFVAAQVEVWAAADTGAVGRPLAALLAAGITLPLLVRSAPLVVLLVVVGCATLDARYGVSLGWSWFAMLVAVHTLGRRAGTVPAVVGMTVVAGVLLAFDVPRLQEGAPVDEVLPGWVIVAGVFGFGRWLRHRAEEQRVLRDRTARLERDREREVAETVAHEQARIARELHDLVAHALAVIVLQSQAAARVVGTDVDEARAALGSIEQVGREGLAELRRLLDVLETAGAEDDGSRPGLAHLDELAERVRGTGVPVEVSVAGSPRRLPAGLDLSAYRIVQEALTNVLKHAGRASARVGIRYLPHALEIDVTDDGTGRPAAPERVGRGLIGMRERAALYGGTVLAGPAPAGGFEVHARFPLEAT